AQAARRAAVGYGDSVLRASVARSVHFIHLVIGKSVQMDTVNAAEDVGHALLITTNDRRRTPPWERRLTTADCSLYRQKSTRLKCGNISSRRSIIRGGNSPFTCEPAS